LLEYGDCYYRTSPKKEPRRSGVLRIGLADEVLLGGNVGRLETLGTFFYIKGDRLTFAQGFEARALDRVEMYEYILTAVRRGNKTKTF